MPARTGRHHQDQQHLDGVRVGLRQGRRRPSGDGMTRTSAPRIIGSRMVKSDVAAVDRTSPARSGGPCVNTWLMLPRCRGGGRFLPLRRVGRQRLRRALGHRLATYFTNSGDARYSAIQSVLGLVGERLEDVRPVVPAEVPQPLARAGRSRPSCRRAASTMSRSRLVDQLRLDVVGDHDDRLALLRRPVRHLAHLREHGSRLRCGSSGEVGSSRNSRLGLVSSSRPMLTRFFWPPDSRSMRVSACLVISSSSSTSLHPLVALRRARCPGGSAARPVAERGLRGELVVRDGLSAAPGRCAAAARRSSRTGHGSRRRRCPWWPGRLPVSALSSVDLPAPAGPMTAIMDRSASGNVMPSSSTFVLAAVAHHDLQLVRLEGGRCRRRRTRSVRRRPAGRWRGRSR